MPLALDKKAISIGVLAVLAATSVCVKLLWQQEVCVEVFPDGSKKTLYDKDCDLLLAAYTFEENQGLNPSPRRHLEVLKYPLTTPRSFEAALDDTSELSVFPQRRSRRLRIRRVTRGDRPKLNFRATVAHASHITSLTKKIIPGSNAKVKTFALRGRLLKSWATRKYDDGGNEA